MIVVTVGDIHMIALEPLSGDDAAARNQSLQLQCPRFCCLSFDGLDLFFTSLPSYSDLRTSPPLKCVILDETSAGDPSVYCL